MSRTIHVAHSPDADDAFMFWAMAQGLIDTGGRRYVHELGDIESLNRRAVPGELTTAFLTLRLYQPDVRHVVVPFDQIEDFVVAGKADAGLLIHEGQLTFGDRGLHLWADMGEWWYGETRLPLPLGGNVVRRDLGDELMRAIARDLKASIEYGLAHRTDALRHAQGFSRGLDAARTDR